MQRWNQIPISQIFCGLDNISVPFSLLAAAVLIGMLLILGAIALWQQSMQRDRRRDSQVALPSSNEDSLRESDRRLRTLISNLPGYVYRVANDQNYTPEFISEGVYLVTGYRSDEYLLDRTISRRQEIHPQDAAVVWEIVQQAVAVQQPYECEYRIITKSGEQKWVWERGWGVYSDQGDLICLEGFVTDISDRKTAQQAQKLQRDFNLLIAEVTSRFVDVAAEAMDAEIERTLHLIGEITQADTSYIFKYDEAMGISSMTHEWCRPNYPHQMPMAQTIPCWQLFPWSSAKLVQQEIICIPSVAELPPEAVIDQRNWQQFNLVSILMLPLVQKSSVTGAIGFASLSHTFTWDEETIRLLQVMAQTITNARERIQNERQRFENEERLRLALTASNQGLYDLNIATGEAVVSPEYATMLGYNPATFHETNAQWIERLHPDDREPVAQVYRDYVAGLIPEYKVEFRQRTQSGDWKWILSLGKILAWDENGNPLRMLGTHTDIDDRKQAEAERLQTEQVRNELKLLENILDIILAGYWDWDIPNHYEYLSPGFKHMFGYADHELPNVPESWQRLIFAEDLPGVLDCFNHHVQSGGKVPFYNEVRYRHKNGSTVWVICSGEVIEWDRLGNPVRVIGCHINITHLKQVEEQLRKSDTHLKIAQRIAQLGSWEFNIQTRQITWSEEVFSIFGLDPAAGTPSDFETLQQSFHPDDRHLHAETVQTTIATAQPYDREFRIYRPDGDLVYIQIKGEVLLDAMGQPTYLMGTVLDITDRKLTEQKIQQTVAQLAATNQELESFAYSVSHDLRAPLRHIHGFVNALQQQLVRHDAFTNPKVVHYLQVIESSSQKMALLIDGLLTLSRLGRKPMVFAPVPLQNLVEEAITLVKSQPGINSSVEFVVGNLPIVQGDATLLQQVLSNLINNAVKFSRNAPTPRIEIGSTSGDTIFVRDNGVGIDMKYAEKLFGAFQRLHAQTEFEGTGIGLAIVQRIIHRHGGTIWAESQPNQGATFYFTVESHVGPAKG